MKKILLPVFVLCCALLRAQSPDLVAVTAPGLPVHQHNIGRIAFMQGNIPLEKLRESEFLRDFRLDRSKSLNIRVFMDNSITNYMHQIAPALSAEQLLANGNFQFSFLVDGKLVYRENIHHGCNYGSGGDKNSSTSFRVPFTSTTAESWWAMNLWDRFLSNGGAAAMGNGKHRLTVQLRPYVQLPEGLEPGDAAGSVDAVLSSANLRVGQLIAEGSLGLQIAKPVVRPGQVKVQPIKPATGWDLSSGKTNPKAIGAMNYAIAAYDLKDITSVVVIKDGRLLIEEYFNGATRDSLHDTRSVGKSFASTIMGIAIRDGYIRDENETLSSVYKLDTYNNYSAAKDSIRFRDLLVMGSCFDGSDQDGNSPGNEENMYPAPDWVRFALNLPVDTVKLQKQRWDYFTAGVVILGDVLDRRVPGGLEKYAAAELFEPLGIHNYQWQYTPQHVPNTAGSLKMRALDYARYVQLYKDRGMYKGRQLLPGHWVDTSLSRQLSITGREGEYYGYLFWNKTLQSGGKSYDTWYCAGNGGNHLVIFRDQPLVIVITAKAYNKPYAHAQADRIITEYLLPSLYGGFRAPVK
ncbi:MAG: class C beta-lactamase-related serine hydrolase [Chitinophagaceae bacterium]|nr:MAG: class C beta-lactamase-related serine hydrolase [Chitinophagaceae bacterium]